MRAYIRKILALVIRNAFLTMTVNGGRGSGRLDMAAVSNALVGVRVSAKWESFAIHDYYDCFMRLDFSLA